MSFCSLAFLFVFIFFITYLYVHIQNGMTDLKWFYYRDFAYVARDRLTRIHMCHVFRCDTAARTIANTLRYVYYWQLNIYNI